MTSDGFGICDWCNEDLPRKPVRSSVTGLLYCCQECSREDEQAHRDMRCEEPDYGGTFDGYTVTSDADPGL